jgi:hypothetical protein
MGGHLSVGDRWRIISLSLDQGMTSSEIASIIHCTSRTMFLIVHDCIVKQIMLLNEKDVVVLC